MPVFQFVTALKMVCFLMLIRELNFVTYALFFKEILVFRISRDSVAWVAAEVMQLEDVWRGLLLCEHMVCIACQG